MFLALVGLALLAGTLAGALDAAATIARGHAATPPASLVVHAASFGAALALGASLPFVLLTALLRRPRSPERRLGLLIALLATSPALLALARSLHKRIPWDAADLGAGLGGLVALGLVVVGAGEVLARLGGRIGPTLASLLARLAPLLCILLVPFVLCAERAARPVDGGHADARGTNLLLLTVDTLRPDRLGAYGDPTARTPWIDRLARTSALHATCVTPSPWTLPSLGSILTGTYPGEHRVLEELSGLSE